MKGTLFSWNGTNQTDLFFSKGTNQMDLFFLRGTNQRDLFYSEWNKSNGLFWSREEQITWSFFKKIENLNWNYHVTMKVTWPHTRFVRTIFDALSDEIEIENIWTHTYIRKFTFPKSLFKKRSIWFVPLEKK